MSRRHPVAPPRRLRRGIALMEALIGVLLLSMAALAYAALQARGLGANASALWRSKATLMAYEMADRLRANPTGVTDGRYNNLTSAVDTPDCGVNSACSTANMALLDFAQWRTGLGQALPGGTGVVCLDATPDDGDASAPGCDGQGAVYAVKVFWSERGQASRLAVAVRP